MDTKARESKGEMLIQPKDGGETIRYWFDHTEKGQVFFNKTLWWAMHNANVVTLHINPDWHNKDTDESKPN